MTLGNFANLSCASSPLKRALCLGRLIVVLTVTVVLDAAIAGGEVKATLSMLTTAEEVRNQIDCC